MFTASQTRPFAKFLHIIGFRTFKKAAPKGRAPAWIHDPQLSDQLLKDTGLSPEDFGGRPLYQQDKPFFLQNTLW